MKRAQAKEVIKLYQPQKGFYDLSEKPKTLSEIDYAKVIDTQNLLVRANKNIEYYLEKNKTQLRLLQEINAKLQQVILQYWT